MKTLYIITILLAYTLFMLIRKTEKKQNLVQWILISLMLILCYNVLAGVALTFIGQLCTLENFSICNFIIIAILLAALLKNKKIQKYYIKISDILVSVLFLILVIFIAYKQYDIPFNIKYKITDGSTHYFFAQQFYENSTLLYNEATDDFLGMYNSNFRLPGAYINEGILFKLFDNVALTTTLFIIFDLCILYLSGMLFYYLLKTYAKENKKMYILAAIFSILYMLSYQLNSMLYGYVYLSFALSLIITFLLIMANYEKKQILSTIALPILSLLSFGIFFSYAYFIPIIYIAIIANIIIRSIKNKEKIFSSKTIAELIYLIIIPLIIGITYFIILPLISGRKTEISTIGVDGMIYENYITNYLIYIPIFLISTIYWLKNKEKGINFPTILLGLSILFAIILFIGKMVGIVSKYYFFKSYYIIWLLTIYNAYIAITYILEEKSKAKEIICYVYTGIYVILLIISTLILKKNIKINDIFYDNLENNINQGYALNSGELKIIKKLEEITKNNDIYILAPEYTGRMLWLSVLSHNQYIYIDFVTSNNVTIERWLNEKEEKYYLAYYNDYERIEEKEEVNSDRNEYKIIYNDEYGFILERK